VDPFTTLTIGNQALALLGAQPVAQVDEGTELASTLFRIGPVTLEAALAAHPWACTIALIRLSRLADQPESGFRYAFALPPGLIELRSVLSHPQGAPLASWRVVGTELHADAEDAWADVRREPPLGQWPPHLVAYARAQLAADLALAITGSASDAQLWAARAAEAFAAARRVEAQQQPHRAMHDFPLIAARLGGV
jgi:hypothetical protein